MQILQCHEHQHTLSVTFSDQFTADFSLFWLRDHSTDSASLNPSTLQRDYATFASDIPPIAAQQAIVEDGHALHIHWQNEDVVSKFDATFLYRLASDTSANPQNVYRVWGNDLQDKITDFDFNEIVQSDAQFLPVLEAMETHGIVTFSNMPSDMSATRKLIEQVGYVRKTVFGDVWDFSNNEAHADSAYTSVGIGLHTDGTYTIDPPGLQLLHCLAFDGEGGFNQFADGFNIAQAIKRQDPDAYRLLCDIKVPAHYIEPGVQLRAQHPVITETTDGYLEQICFNNFDRSPMYLPSEQQAAFYRAYGLFEKYANDPAFQVTLQLRPGRAVWFNNWRTLHARSAFSGFRHMAGGYNNREDVVSKLLTLRGQSPWQA